MDVKNLQHILNQSYNRENWKQIVQFVFPNVSIFENPKEFPIENEKIKRFAQLGNVRLNDGKNLALFELTLANDVNLQRNRVELNSEVSKYIDQEQIHGVLSVFEQGREDYRFTFSARSTEFDEEESDFVTKKTDTKRFTYVLGQNESCKTAAKRFFELSENKDSADIEAIQKAFSVEKLSKEFFDKYKSQFEKFWGYINTNDEYRKLFLDNDKEKQIRDFTKKLLGRIVFLHFLQKKGWMGCDAQVAGWENGEKQFMQKLFADFAEKNAFHSKCLHQLFFNTLNNNKRENFIFQCDGVSAELNGTKIPYLNGGLFDADKEISAQIDFPQAYFTELFDLFSQYNFTIDENDPNDHEVGIDPEMLGHIFENLLEDNKDKGAFYTPKIIVQYMCQESLIEYLATKLNAEPDTVLKSAIEDLVRNRLAQGINDLDKVDAIAQALHVVKICDPAIGSGAFPMGILNEIFKIIEDLYFLQPDAVSEVWNIDSQNWQPHLVKKSIIQNSIYGVDLESGAVDIARLRFWLALIVDETKPLPLPNLDYKIMQGNSLLESYEGIDLSQIADSKAYEEFTADAQIDIFTGEAKKKVKTSVKVEDIQQLMQEYFSISEPEKKKEIHEKIDEQVFNHIKYQINKHKISLKKNIEVLEAKVQKDANAAKTEEQKTKILTNSKAAKDLIKNKTELSEYIDKDVELNRIIKSNDKPFFLWNLYFKDVFDQGGFDIVIGNPPYLSNKGVSDNIKIHYNFSDDLYNYFFIRGEELLKDNGIFCYITSNTFLTLNSKENIRNLILNKNLLSIVNLGYDVFDSAMVSTAITIYRNSESKSNHEFLMIDLRGVKDFNKAKKYNLKQSELFKIAGKVFFMPNNYNLKIHKLYSETIIELKDKYWDKISTSQNISKNFELLNLYRNNLKEGDITLLGLITDGGQGLATANNGKFIGVIENSQLANNIKISRFKKIKEFNFKHKTNYDISNLTETEIRILFDDLKEKFGRDIFGQGYLYRIISKDEIVNISDLTEDEKIYGIKNRLSSYVRYDKGDKEGNRWFSPTVYYINWNYENVNFLKKNSGKKGVGMPVVRNSQFYFRNGFCWSDIHTQLIKSRIKPESVYDVKSMSLFPLLENITSKFLVCILNSKFASEFTFEFVNNTSTLQINDARLIPIKIPSKSELKLFENIFDNAKEIQENRINGIISKDDSMKLLNKIQNELDKEIDLYFNLCTNNSIK